MLNPISYSVQDAIAVTGLGRTTMYELMKSGAIKRIKIGSRTVILRSDLEQFLARAAAAA